MLPPSFPHRPGLGRRYHFLANGLPREDDRRGHAESPSSGLQGPALLCARDSDNLRTTLLPERLIELFRTTMLSSLPEAIRCNKDRNARG